MNKNSSFLENKPTVSKQFFSVVKRNGKLVPFNIERIRYAIESAFCDSKQIEKDTPIDDETKQAIQDVTDIIAKKTLKLAMKGTRLTVEGIQDLVEVTLMKQGHHDVARSFIVYRDQRKQLRESSYLHLKIFRHDRSTVVRFNPMKIANTIELAFRRAKKIQDQSLSDEIVNAVNLLTQNVIQEATNAAEKNESLYCSDVQDWIEKHLMQERFFDIAKQYILYRFEKSKKHEIAEHLPIQEKEKKFKILTEENKEKIVTESQIKHKFSMACRDLGPRVSVDELFNSSILHFYQGMKEKDLDLANIMAARSFLEKDPAYSFVAARLLLDCIYREILSVPIHDRSIDELHQHYFKKYIKDAVKIKRLSQELLDFDLDELASALNMDRDLQFTYLGLQTLYDRYFIHKNQKRLETPQIFWMRVAMGLATGEGKEKNKRAREFYDTLSQFYYVSSTPTLFNSGTTHPQLSSCYLSTVMDDLHHIFKVVADDAQLSKWAGGLGNDWTNIRATGALIKGTNGKSQGVIPFLKVANDTAVAVNQCFAPETSIYTAKGIKPIAEVKKGDLVLGISGCYREVLETYAYNQKDAMVEIDTASSLDPISVTAGHPFYAIRGIPMEQEEHDIQSIPGPEWIESGKLEKGDYVAQAIPREVIKFDEIDDDDAHLYGILLRKGDFLENKFQWKVSGNSQTAIHLEFVRTYLKKRNIHFTEIEKDSGGIQIHWESSKRAVRDATTDRFVEGDPTLPFTFADLHNGKNNCKWISPRFSHLPPSQTLALIQGLIGTNSNIPRNKEIIFCSTSLLLVEELRYQLLRLGVPSELSFNKTKKQYDVRIPATREIADKPGCRPLTKYDWLKFGNYLFTRVKSVIKTKVSPFVYDLSVEGDESYMTTSALAHNGGKRKGAMCAYLETWHLDIEDFTELRKNTGDERRRTHDMNTANWIPDLFMKRVKEKSSWTLFSPDETSDLHDLYGKAFEKRYCEYETMAEEGKIKNYKKIDALKLWRKMLSMLFETGHPWITFKDPSNLRSPQDHAGVVHSSNLCTEILLNTSKEEVAVCNLGSINLAKHTAKDGIDEKRLAKTVQTAIRMLDNVIDINYYPIQEAKTANLRHRPIGLGLMGFQDALYIQNISFASQDAVEFADQSMEMISYYAIYSSSQLAKERGKYSSFKGSKWDRGLLPIDTIDLLEKERQEKIEMNRKTTMDWNLVRESVKKHGMRNSNTMAIAPTATIANISGVTQSIEPMYKHLFVKSNLSGEFMVTNPYLVTELKKLSLWDSEMIDDLKYYDGSIAEVGRIPESLKKRFPVAFEIEPEWLIECASRRQKWIDMGQSLNLYLAEPNGKKLSQMYFLAWSKGLKTLYYLRSLGATQIEKSSIDINKRGLQPRWMKSKSASSGIKVERTVDVPVCNLEEGCESCQ